MPAIKEIIDHFSEYPAFSYRDVVLYLRSRKLPTRNITRLLSYMKSNGKIYAVKKGVYTLIKDDMVAGFAYPPFYYGLLSALTIRELWTRNSKPEVITLRKVRKSKVQIFGSSGSIAFIHHIPAKYFFGFDIVTYGKLRVPTSDPEKTLIDLFYYKVGLPIQNLSQLLKAIDKRKLETYPNWSSVCKYNHFLSHRPRIRG